MAPSGASMGIAPSGVPMAPTSGPMPSVMHQTCDNDAIKE